MWWNRYHLLRLTLLVALVPLAAAQKPGPRQPTVNLPAPGHSVDSILVTTKRIPLPEGQKTKNDTCLSPPLDSIRSSVITAGQLRVPAKATKEYRRACSALRKKRYSDAEQHLRKAVQEYPQYATAWVTLGQMLANENRSEDARNACDRAATADPIYVPAQLCLAEIASRSQDWSEELKHAIRALELDPNSLLAYEYEAAANANLQNLHEAERSGLRAIEHDKDHHDPAAYLVMAQIYKLKGEAAHEEEQLREYLK
jgi:tetratricopeptide (TPR) repeat protein